MFRTLTLFVAFGMLILAVSCAEEPKKEEAAPTPAAAQPAAETKAEGPYYELTKDDVTSHPDWTSMNVTFKGAKIGDKKAAIEKALGTAEKVDPIGTDHYRSVFGKSSFAIYTYKMTGELQKIEIFGRSADLIADPKFKKLLATGDLAFLHQAFGMEEKAEMNFDTTGMEYIYDAKGFRFAKYNLASGAVHSIIFSKIKK